MPHDNRFVETDRLGKVTYRVEGKTGQTVILLHGWNGHSGTWSSTIDALKGMWTVVAPSLPPFFGDFKDIPLADYTSALGQIVRQEGITSAVLAGNSMGGWISMNYSMLNTNFARAIVLEDTAGAGYGNNVEDSQIYIYAVRKSGIPVLIIWGEHDDVIPSSTAERLAGELPLSVCHVIKGAGHVPHRDLPGEFNELVMKFLSGLSTNRI